MTHSYVPKPNACLLCNSAPVEITPLPPCCCSSLRQSMPCDRSTLAGVKDPWLTPGIDPGAPQLETIHFDRSSWPVLNRSANVGAGVVAGAGPGSTVGDGAGAGLSADAAGDVALVGCELRTDEQPIVAAIRSTRRNCLIERLWSESLLAPKPRQFYRLVQRPVPVSPAVSVVERMFAVIITFVFSHGTLVPHLSFPLVTQNRSAD